MKLYRIFLPKTYDTKKKIPLKIILKILEDIEERFGAYSMNPFAQLPLIGCWKDNKDKKYEEEHFEVELFTEDTFENKRWIIAYKEMIRQKLKQEEHF